MNTRERRKEGGREGGEERREGDGDRETEIERRI